MQYADTDMTIEISDAATRTADNERTGTFKVRVLDSPVGGMNLDKAVIVEYNDKDLQSALGRLERRELDTEGLVMLGRTLAAMLLPITAQDGVHDVWRSFVNLVDDRARDASSHEGLGGPARSDDRIPNGSKAPSDDTGYRLVFGLYADEGL